MARSEDEGMMLIQLIAGVVEVASGAHVHVAATAVKHIVGLGHSLCLLSVSAGGCSFLYRPFGNLGAFIRPRIGLTAVFVDLIRVFCRQATALRGRDSGVWKTSAWNWAGWWSILGSNSVSEIPKFLQICSSVSESASVHDIVGDIPGCGGAGCGNVAKHSICRVFCGHLRLTCVEIYNKFQRLYKINYKFPHIGCPEGSWLIDRRVEVARAALMWRLNSNRCCTSLLLFHRLWCR